MVVTARAHGRELEVSRPRPLFVADHDLSRAFDLSPDGQRLLMTRSRQQDRITLVLNWPRELERLTTAGRSPR
jgi:hypothetical protein